MRFLTQKLVAGGVTVALAAMVFASTALAASHNPTGEFAQFGECPLNRVTLTDCVRSVSTGGAFKVGTKTVPLSNPVTLQGGFEGGSPDIEFYGAENGDTLSKTPQPVPGGLLGLLNCPAQTNPIIKGLCEVAFENGLTGVNAIVELTGPTKGLTNIDLDTQNLLERKGTALGLPVKIRLENPTLGSNCYIGSDKAPVQLKFTTGTSGSLEGSKGTLSFNTEFTLITVSGAKLVDGTFAAPAATGCGGLLSILVNPVLNAVLGLPSASGKNEATLEGNFQDAASSAVIESE
jgi:hypothetical protein